MRTYIKLGLIMHIVFASGICLNSGIFQEILAQNSSTPNQNSEAFNNITIDQKNGLANVPLVINITKNSNATETVIDFIIKQVNSSVVDTSVLEELAKDRIPLLIQTLKNTNASSIAAEYILNTTKGVSSNITCN